MAFRVGIGMRAGDQMVPDGPCKQEVPRRVVLAALYALLCVEEDRCLSPADPGRMLRARKQKRFSDVPHGCCICLIIQDHLVA
ncbi:MAG TPA: hypothetical protein DEB52_11925 [Hyphomonas sp.]|nr:hypothetical protein [Hyphomonas sp.]